MKTPAKKKPAKAESPGGKCFNCHKAVKSDDFCFGCRTFVCEPCNKGGLNVPWGAHDKNAHLREDGDDA